LRSDGELATLNDFKIRRQQQGGIPVLNERFVWGAQVDSDEVSSFRALDRKSGKSVLVHILPNSADRKKCWLDRLEKKIQNTKDHGVVELIEDQGSNFVVTTEFTNWKGFEEWLAESPATASEGSVSSEVKQQIGQFVAGRNRPQSKAVPPVQPPANEAEEFFVQQTGATELFRDPKKRAAVGPSKPQPVGPSEYSLVLRGRPVPPSGASPAPNPTPNPAPNPAADLNMQQAFEIKRLESVAAVWKMVALAAVGLAALSMVLIVVLFLNK